MGPLARFIELTEVALVCVDSEPARYATSGLVMCGRGYDTQPWLKKALRFSNSVVAVLLADVDPGVKNARRVDLRAWPGRSADRTVLALAEWLKSDGKSSFPGMSAKSAASASPQRSQNIAALVVLSVIIGLFVLMARSTDLKSAAVLPSSQPPTVAPVSSTATPKPSHDANTAKATNTAKSTSGSTAAVEPTVPGHAVADLQVDPKPPMTSEQQPRNKQLPATSRVHLDRCYLLRRTDGDVPPRACLISNAVRLLGERQAH